MKAVFFLVIQGRKLHNFSNHRELGEVAVRKRKPSTNADEIAVRMELDIPDSLFEKPTLQINASVPDDGSHGPEITTDVADNIAQIIREQTGINVRIEAAEELA